MSTARRISVLIALACLACVGCPPPPRATPAGTTPEPIAVTSPEAAEPPAVAPPATTSTSQSPAPSAPASIRVTLRRGVALPQLLPDGTRVLFSVEYQCSGTLATSSRFFAVLESNVGEFRLPIKLEAQGTIQGIAPDSVQPNTPLAVRVEELRDGADKPARISNSETLR